MLRNSKEEIHQLVRLRTPPWPPTGFVAVPGLHSPCTACLGLCTAVLPPPPNTPVSPMTGPAPEGSAFTLLPYSTEEGLSLP